MNNKTIKEKLIYACLLGCLFELLALLFTTKVGFINHVILVVVVVVVVSSVVVVAIVINIVVIVVTIIILII